MNSIENIDIEEIKKIGAKGVMKSENKLTMLFGDFSKTLDQFINELINENIEIQRQLYAEIEKNEQVLFIIRSLNSMNPLYEKITKELVASVRGEKTRHIVTSFLKGESIYEIAQREGKSATSVRRMVLLSLMVKTRK